MTLETFTNGIKRFQKFDFIIDSLCDLGVDLNDSELYAISQDLFNYLLGEYFSDAGIDFIYWWLYEADVCKVVSVENVTLFGKEEHKIKLETIEDLWKYLHSDKIYLKNGTTYS